MSKLLIELVPKGQFGDNLRTRLPKAEWDRLRALTYAAAGYRCEVCGGRGNRWPVECHERWEYNDTTNVQKLVGLFALCPPCHEVKHFGLASVRGRAAEALAQLATVNEWSLDDAARHVETAFATWRARSEKVWTLDLTWLDSA